VTAETFRGLIMSTKAYDEAEILRLDSAWNEAYVRRNREPLAQILADDFTGLTASGEPITKAILMINPPGVVKSVSFTEQDVRVFGDTAISRGRLTLEGVDRRVDQRFLRVFARRDGTWRAVAVSVTPVAN
jgi:ketosteroid isomerase-like protein